MRSAGSVRVWVQVRAFGGGSGLGFRKIGSASRSGCATRKKTRTQPDPTGLSVAVVYGHGRLMVAVASILVKVRTGKKPFATSCNWFLKHIQTNLKLTL